MQIALGKKVLFKRRFAVPISRCSGCAETTVLHDINDLLIGVYCILLHHIAVVAVSWSPVAAPGDFNFPPDFLQSQREALEDWSCNNG